MKKKIKTKIPISIVACKVNNIYTRVKNKDNEEYVTYAFHIMNILGSNLYRNRSAREHVNEDHKYIRDG